MFSYRLVEEHARTLEKVTELWKQKWPVNWDEVQNLSKCICLYMEIIGLNLLNSGGGVNIVCFRGVEYSPLQGG